MPSVLNNRLGMWNSMNLPNPSIMSRSIFKRSKTGLNLDFSFHETGCLTKSKVLSVPH